MSQTISDYIYYFKTISYIISTINIFYLQNKYHILSKFTITSNLFQFISLFQYFDIFQILVCISITFITLSISFIL